MRRYAAWRRALPSPWVVVCLLAVLGLAACEQPKPKLKMPARLLYYQGERLMDQKLYGEAVTKFQAVADQNPGTMLGSYAYLQIADARVLQDEMSKADTNYRLFLGSQETSHLTPYVLYRLAEVNDKESYTGVFFPTRETDRDQTANHQLIQDYRRFYFLYPNSMFLPKVRQYANNARNTLAAHERGVGDFYFDRKHYNAAASRYLYLLRHYPDYPEAPAVLKRLIVAYRRNQQPKLAAELERLHKEMGQFAAAKASPAPAKPASAETAPLQAGTEGPVAASSSPAGQARDATQPNAMATP